MKAIVFILILTMTGFLFVSELQARPQTYKPHSQINNPQLVKQLHQQMSILNRGFAKIEANNTAMGVNHEEILKAVDEMDATQQTIRLIIANPDWGTTLDGLSAQLQQIRKAATKQNTILVRSKVDGLYDACFRCHSANAPKY